MRRITDDLPPPEVFHPAEYLRDEMEAREWDIEYVANNLDAPLGLIRRLLMTDEPVSNDMLIAIAHLTKTSETLWLRLGAAWRKHSEGI